MKVIAIGSTVFVDNDNILLTHTVITHKGYNIYGQYAHITANRTKIDKKWNVYIDIFGEKMQHLTMTTKEMYEFLKKYA